MQLEVDVSHIDAALPRGRERFLASELPRHLAQFYSRSMIYHLIKTHEIESVSETPRKTYVYRESILSYFKRSLAKRI